MYIMYRFQQKISDYIQLKFLCIFSNNVLKTKVLQMMGGVDNLADDVKEIVKQNMNKVSYTEQDIDYSRLLYIIQEYNLKLDSFKPVNAGMVSLVYKGVDNNGRKIVVKLKRLGIENKIKKDYVFFNKIINLLYTLTYFNCKLRTLLYNFKSLINTQTYMLSQCEFSQEMNAMSKICSTVSKYTDQIVIPCCYNKPQDRELGADFIIMDQVNGDDCLNIEDVHKEELCRLLWLFTFITYNHSELLHMDLHPGNILFEIKDNVVYLNVIDFGMNLAKNDLIQKYSDILLNKMMNKKEIIVDEKFTQTMLEIFEQNINIKTMSASQINDIGNVINRFINSAVRGSIGEKELHVVVESIQNISKNGDLSLKLDFIKYSMGMSMLNSTLEMLVKDAVKNKQIRDKTLTEVMLY